LTCDPVATAGKFLDLRDNFYDAIAKAKPQLLTFLRGWHNRIVEERTKLDLA
jgi:hypothetical protein